MTSNDFCDPPPPPPQLFLIVVFRGHTLILLVTLWHEVTLGQKFHLCIQRPWWNLMSTVMLTGGWTPQSFFQDHPPQYSESALARCQCSQRVLFLLPLAHVCLVHHITFSFHVPHTFLSVPLWVSCRWTVPSRRTSPSFFCALSPCCSPPAASSPPVSDALQGKDTVYPLLSVVVRQMSARACFTWLTFLLQLVIIQ